MGMNTNGFIYGLKDILTFEIRYVGKATYHRRPKEHFKPVNLNGNHNIHKNNWIKKHKRDHNVFPDIVILEKDISINTLGDREIYWIALFQGPKLLNLTHGGEGTIGYKHKEETIEKLRERAKKRDRANYKNPHNKKNNIFIGDKEFRQCAKCDLLQPITDFRWTSRNRWASYCNPCYRVVWREWRTRSPSRKLSKEEYAASKKEAARKTKITMENRYKTHPELKEAWKRKLRLKRSKPVIAIHIKTGEIKEFPGALFAPGFNNVNIGIAIMNQTPYKGYLWKKKI